MDTNRIFISGNIVQDADIGSDAKGANAYFAIASNRAYRDGSSWKEDTTFIEVEVYDNLAARNGPHLKKGVKVYIEGRLAEVSIRNVKTYAIVASAINFIERMPSPGAARAAAAPQQNRPPTPAAGEPAKTGDVRRRSVSEALAQTSGVGDAPPVEAPFEEDGPES